MYFSLVLEQCENVNFTPLGCFHDVKSDTIPRALPHYVRFGFSIISYIDLDFHGHLIFNGRLTVQVNIPEETIGA